MPFWTVILLTGRIPRELYEAADMDGATGPRRFIQITVPLLANFYLVSTLLSTIFTLGDFNAVYLVSGGAPALSTHVLATLGIRNAGVATVMPAMPR
jgi:multiple sugar transport system permease protein